MDHKRHAKLFKNGRNQAVRIPREFEFSVDEVIMHKDGEHLIIEPSPRNRSLLELLATLQQIDEKFPLISDPPPDSVEI